MYGYPQQTFLHRPLATHLGDNGIPLEEAMYANSDILINTGMAYQHEKRFEKALMWFRLAAAKNHSVAQNNIGVMYAQGHGVHKDMIAAMEWFLKSATQDDKLAWRNIGLHFDSCFGVSRNHHKALEWYYKYYSETGENQKKKEKIGIQLTEDEKNKSIVQLILETEDILQKEKKRIENEFKFDILDLKREKITIQTKCSEKDQTISSLNEEIRAFRVITRDDKQEEIDSLRRKIEQYERDIREINDENEALGMIIDNQLIQIQNKDSEVEELKNEIASMKIK